MEKQTSGISFTPFSFTYNGLSLSSKRIYLPTLTQRHSLQSLLLQNTSHTVAATDTEFSGESGKIFVLIIRYRVEKIRRQNGDLEYEQRESWKSYDLLFVL